MSYKNQWPTNRLLSTAARLVEHAWNENLASLGITHAGVMALDVLRSEGSMTQAQLAHQVRVQAQTMGKTLTRLEAHGHIARERNAVDRRSYVMVLTEKGRRALAEAAEIEHDLAGTGVLDHEELRQALEQVIRDLSETDTMPLDVVRAEDPGLVSEISPASSTPRE